MLGFQLLLNLQYYPPLIPQRRKSKITLSDYSDFAAPARPIGGPFLGALPLELPVAAAPRSTNCPCCWCDSSMLASIVDCRLRCRWSTIVTTILNFPLERFAAPRSEKGPKRGPRVDVFDVNFDPFDVSFFTRAELHAISIARRFSIFDFRHQPIRHQTSLIYFGLSVV